MRLEAVLGQDLAAQVFPPAPVPQPDSTAAAAAPPQEASSAVLPPQHVTFTPASTDTAATVQPGAPEAAAAGASTPLAADASIHMALRKGPQKPPTHRVFADTADESLASQPESAGSAGQPPPAAAAQELPNSTTAVAARPSGAVQDHSALYLPARRAVSSSAGLVQPKAASGAAAVIEPGKQPAVLPDGEIDKAVAIKPSPAVQPRPADGVAAEAAQAAERKALRRK